jgi:hypothetical protein
LIYDTLGQLENLLSDAKALEDKYHLELLREQGNEAGAENSDDAKSTNYVTKALSRILPDMKLASSQSSRNSTSTWTKIKWGVTGKTKMKELIFDIDDLIQAVVRLTRSRENKFLVRGMERLVSELLAGTVSRTDVDEVNATLEAHASTTSPASLYQPEAALGMLRARRMTLGLDLTNAELREADPPISGRTRITPRRRIKTGEVQFTEPLGSDRAMGIYQGSRVLLEYKRITPNLEDKLKHRVEALGMLLSESNDDLLGILPCKGYYNDVGSDRYIFVFQLPEAEPAGSSVNNVTVRTLLEYISDLKTPQPPLQSRLAMALRVAEALRNLHTVGWLHKAIRSENILFCTNPSATEWNEGTRGPYLAGFGFARAANLTEFSETPQAIPEIEIYCHDAIVGPNPKSFRKIFDLYALGILLLEIGIWKPFSKIIGDALASKGKTLPADSHVSPRMRRELLQEDRVGSVMQNLAVSCPGAYCEAVKICIDSRLEDQWDELECTVRSQTDILDKLLSLQ